jgi:hypothetical protein
LEKLGQDMPRERKRVSQWFSSFRDAPKAQAHGATRIL